MSGGEIPSDRQAAHAPSRPSNVIEGRQMLRVLIAEDDFLMADMLEEILLENG